LEQKNKGRVMKREKVVSIAVTIEEYNVLLKKMTDIMISESKVYRMSEFLRDHLLLPYLRGLLYGAAPQETPPVSPPISTPKVPSNTPDGPAIDSEWNAL
jgi:hypothetical protein